MDFASSLERFDMTAEAVLDAKCPDCDAKMFEHCTTPSGAQLHGSKSHEARTKAYARAIIELDVTGFHDPDISTDEFLYQFQTHQLGESGTNAGTGKPFDLTPPGFKYIKRDYDINLPREELVKIFHERCKPFEITRPLSATRADVLGTIDGDSYYEDDEIHWSEE